MYYLFDKYKPNNLNEFIIDDKTKQLLKILINTNSLNILIIGDTGTGKTTLLDVILNEYYKNYNYKESVMYINLLKEQGIHCFRQSIKTFCQTNNNNNVFKKTIIIDNIDQINEQTQQIIRNNIDKYNHRINFLLSCSNIQKVLDTLQSRVNIIKLMNIAKEQLYDFAKKIIQSENINIEEISIKYLVNISNNSIRLLLSFLSKIILLNNNISFDDIKKICTQISYSFFDEYTNLWFNEKNFIKASEKIMQLTELGYSVMDVLETYFFYIKSISNIEDKYKFIIFPILCKYINIFHSVHEETFELTVFTYELYNKICN
jgi:DNA polymerase III delta prime subunit